MTAADDAAEAFVLDQRGDERVYRTLEYVLDRIADPEVSIGDLVRIRRGINRALEQTGV